MRVVVVQGGSKAEQRLQSGGSRYEALGWPCGMFDRCKFVLEL